ncbi:MAG: hypothetical protein Q8R76_09640 [Candidatus Omnitrophota bacterium]|nr:hypothetical protein [Candidatus Omnitrophota bacterium]
MSPCKGHSAYYKVLCCFIAAAMLVSVPLPRLGWAGGEHGGMEHGGSEFKELHSNWYDPFYPLGQTKGASRLSDVPVPFQGVDKIPPRPKLHLELGDPFLDSGNLFPGFELPTGAVWQPRLWSYMIYRTALHSFEVNADSRTSEWVHRLDTYTSLQLTGTERILVSFRPLDKNRFDQFTRFDLEDPNNDEGFRQEFNLNLRALFMEGDMGSLFPFLDPEGMRPMDFGFSVGRQNLNFQDGIMLNDDMDALAIVRNNIRIPAIGISNLRITGMWAWKGNDRGGGITPPNRRSPEADVFGLFNSADFHKSTINIDGIFISDNKTNGGDAFYTGVSSIQRMGAFNTTFRWLGSYAEDSTTPQTGSGQLLTGEISWTPHSSDDVVYFNPFIAFGNYTQAGREPILGGPLAPLGILFASPNLGDYRGEIGGAAQDVFGAATGYQAFWNDHHTNLVLETSFRKDYGGRGTGVWGAGFQLQQKLGQHVQLQFEAFASLQENRKRGYGGRSEILLVF